MKKTSIATKLLSLALAISLILSLQAGVFGLGETAVSNQGEDEEYGFWDLRNTDNITTATLTGTLNGEPLTVTRYYGYYAKTPNSVQQQINIYVPNTVTPESAILMLQNNSGWSSNNFPTNTIANNFNLNTTGANPGNIAIALSRGFVVVSYGARSRNIAAVEGKYLGHSPATMSDTKAAIRYIYYNYDNGALAGKGNPERLVITGSSGGGALTTLIAASGNSPDFLPALYEIGTAGVDYVDGTYISTVRDDVFATISYCPITDMPHADMAYEWQYNGIRHKYADSILSHPKHTETTTAINAGLSAIQIKASDELKALYLDYFNGLGLKWGEIPLTTDNLGNSIAVLIGEELGRKVAGAESKTAAEEILKANIDSIYSGAQKVKFDVFAGKYSWFTVHEDLSVTVDYDGFIDFTYWTYQFFKQAPAFDKIGLGELDVGSYKENDLWGTEEQRYNHNNPVSWALDPLNAGKNWTDFANSNEYALIQFQGKMSNPIPYLLDSSDGDSAPYWYVRHGLLDDGTAFAVEATLYHAMMNDSSIKNVNFQFDWMQRHGGSYDNLESYAWLEDVMAAADAEDAEAAKAKIELSIDKHLLNKDDYFNVTASLSKPLESNVAVLDFMYNTDEIEYAGYSLPTGVQYIRSELIEGGVRLIVMVPDYAMQDLATILFQAKETVIGTDELFKVVGRFAVRSGEEKDTVVLSNILGYNPADNPFLIDFDLIYLSNVIDAFGKTNKDADWPAYRRYDYDNNGEINIVDVTYAASNLKL